MMLKSDDGKVIMVQGDSLPSQDLERANVVVRLDSATGKLSVRKNRHGWEPKDLIATSDQLCLTRAWLETELTHCRNSSAKAAYRKALRVLNGELEVGGGGPPDHLFGVEEKP